MARRITLAPAGLISTMNIDGMFSDAMAHLQAGRSRPARSLFEAILEEHPAHAESLHLLGLIHVRDHDLTMGEQMVRRAISLLPGRAPFHNSLALAMRGLGRHVDAAAEFRRALSLRPDSAEIHNNLAATLIDLGQREDAILHYREAAALAPDVAEIWSNLAVALSEGAAPDEVDALFGRAASLCPDGPALNAAYGRWLVSRNRWRDAEFRFSKCIASGGGTASVWTNLGVARQEIGDQARAEAAYRRALSIEPESADALYNLGCLLHLDGKTPEAVASFQAALTADPYHGEARFAACMGNLPVLYHTRDEIETARERYLTALDDLAMAAADRSLKPVLAKAVGTSRPFFLPYQQYDDRSAQEIYGSIVCDLLAETEQKATLAVPPRSEERIRVGIVSGFFCDHTIFRLFLEGWLTQIDRSRFELIGFHTGRVWDRSTELAAGACDKFVHGLNSVQSWSRRLIDHAPHILLYPEVGIDPAASALAARRLASVQCVAWGHPCTTGMRTIDYFLSSSLMEPEGADRFYSETLVRLPGLGVHYRPEPPSHVSSHAMPNLKERAPIYWSGQAIYKYLPEFDCLFPQIARGVGACRFVFVDFAKSAHVTNMFRQRLDRAFAEAGLEADGFCVFLPPMPQASYLAEIGAADVILDTPGWSGGKSSLDCLSQDSVIVTSPGRFMRGRHSAAILRRIGCDETIAQSLEQYVQFAVRLGLDADWRSKIRAKVAMCKHRAFLDDAPIRALEDFMADVVGKYGSEKIAFGQVSGIGIHDEAAAGQTSSTI